MAIPEVKSLRWLEYNFPLTIPAKEESDKLCNAIHLYAKAGADKLEQMAESLDYARTIDAENIQFKIELERMKKKEAAMTAAIRKYVNADYLCPLCKYNDQCARECEDEDDLTTRYWRCKTSEEFEFKED